MKKFLIFLILVFSTIKLYSQPAPPSGVTESRVIELINEYGGGSPGSPDTSIQYNNGGNFAGGNMYYVSGNVGIGTTVPSQVLDISGGIQIGSTANAEAGAVRWDGSNFQGYNGASWLDLDSQGTLLSGTDNYLARFDAAGTNIEDSGIVDGSNTVAITIDSNGNVGIGSSAPRELLDINGNINIPATSGGIGIIKQNGIRILHNTNNQQSFFVGPYAGNLSGTGNYTTALGYQALGYVTSGGANTAVGHHAMKFVTTQGENTAVGAGVMKYFAGNNNAAIGANALGGNPSSGDNNVAVGDDAGRNNNFSGSNNVIVGKNAGINITSGSNNVLVGRSANVSAGTLSNTVAIGYGANSGHSNSVAIGYYAATTASNQCALGSAGTPLNTLVTGDITVSGGDIDLGVKTDIGQDSGGVIDAGYIRFNADGSSSDRRSVIGNDGTKLHIGTDSENEILTVDDNSSEKYVLIHSGYNLIAEGNVGIGTTTPEQLIETTGAITFNEMTAPGTPSSNKGVLYLVDDGDGTQTLYVKFDDGTAVALGAN